MGYRDAVQRVERTTVLAAPADELFAFISALENLPSWQSGIVSVRRTSGSPMVVGSTATVVRELMGQRFEAPLRVAAYDPPRHLAVEGSVSGVKAVATLDLNPTDGETRLTFSMEIRASGFAALMEGMIAEAATKDVEASLERLRRRFAAPPAA
jgi:carbon monoxide dehydrogenase subunit G